MSLFTRWLVRSTRGSLRVPMGVFACVALACLLPFASNVGYGQQPPPGQQEPPPETIEALKEQVRYLSTVPSLILAQEIGLTEIEGMPIDPALRRRPTGNEMFAMTVPRFEGASIALNVPIGVDPTKHENEPTVAVNPRDELKVVAGSHFFGPPPPTANRCLAFTSADGGQTWSEPFLMPQLTPASQCSDPVLAYAPDGNRVYYAYMDIKSAAGLPDYDIVVSFSNDDGLTWVGPIVVLEASTSGPFQFFYDKPWIGTHVDVPGAQPNNSFVYVTATLFRGGAPPFLLPPAAITFVRSTNQGLTWTSARILDVATDPAPGLPQVVVQGSRPAGGLGGEVLVAWYHSGSDGWLEGGFNIRTARSANNGVTFDALVDAAADSSEAPFFLGPFGSFFRWWPTMMPDVEIGVDGIAHIAYTHDPVPQPAPGFTNPSPEDGDIRYVVSVGPPYNAWSEPVTISDDLTGQAQGFAALETALGPGGSFPQVIFVDHRLTPGPPIPPNILFDVFHTRATEGFWSTNARVTDQSSVSDFDFIGDYIDLSAGSSYSFGVWTDRRDKISFLDFEDDVWGGGIGHVLPTLTLQDLLSRAPSRGKQSVNRR